MELRLSGHFAPGGEFCPLTFERQGSDAAEPRHPCGGGASGSGGGGPGWMAAFVPWQREKAGWRGLVRKRRYLGGIQVDIPKTATNVTDYEVRSVQPCPEDPADKACGTPRRLPGGSAAAAAAAAAAPPEGVPLQGEGEVGGEGQEAGAEGDGEEGVERRLSFWHRILELAEGMKRKLSPPSDAQGKKRRHGSVQCSGGGCGGPNALPPTEEVPGEGVEETAQAVQQVGLYVVNCISAAFVLSAFSAFQGEAFQ